MKNCLENFVEKPTPAGCISTDDKEDKGRNNVTTGHGGGTIDLSKVDDAYVALRLEIERSIRVSKKLKDDAVLDLNDIVYDKHLLAILPKNLVTEAIAAQLLCDEQCQKRKLSLLLFSRYLLESVCCMPMCHAFDISYKSVYALLSIYI